MPACIVYGCSNRSDYSLKCKGITFHSFPINPIRKGLWVNAVRRKDWKPTKFSKICSEHFQEKDIDRTSLSSVRIRENAVPSVFPALKKAKLRLRKPIISSQDEAASGSAGTLNLDADQSTRQPTITISSPIKEDQSTGEPPTEIVWLTDNSEDSVPEAEVPQPAQLRFWDRECRMTGMRDSLLRLQDAVTQVSKVSEEQAAKIRELQEKSNSVSQVTCDPRCVELQRTLAILGIGVKLTGIISDSQPGTEFFNPKAATIMNLIRDYTSLY